MKTNSKIIITEVLCELSLYDLEGSLDGIITRLNDYIEYYDNYQNLCLRDAGFDNSHTLQLVGDRLETDSELTKRLKKQEKDRKHLVAQKVKEKTRELEQLERLAKKYKKTLI